MNLRRPEVIAMAGVVLVAGGFGYGLIRPFTRGSRYVQLHVPEECRVLDVDPAFGSGNSVVVFYADPGERRLQIQCGNLTYRPLLKVRRAENYVNWEPGVTVIEDPVKDE